MGEWVSEWLRPQLLWCGEFVERGGRSSRTRRRGDGEAVFGERSVRTGDA